MHEKALADSELAYDLTLYLRVTGYPIGAYKRFSRKTAEALKSVLKWGRMTWQSMPQPQEVEKE